MCFVVVDFLLEVRSVSAILIGVFTIALVVFMLRARHGSKQKQGSYGKVAIRQESVLRQLSRPSEVLAMINFKVLGLGTSKEESCLGYQLESLKLDQGDLQYCAKKLKQVSRSFATVITFLPNTSESPVRLAVSIFYLVLRALDTVEDEMDLSKFNQFVVDEDKQGLEDSRLNAKKRLLRTFSRRMKDTINNCIHEDPLSGLGDGDEKDLLENVDRVLRIMGKLPMSLQCVILDITEEMAQGMADYVARDLKNGTEDSVDFENYCHIAAGTVGDGLTRIFVHCGYAPKTLMSRRDLWDSMGSFLQRTNIIRDYLEDLVDGRAWWPRSVWGEYVTSPSLSWLADAHSIESGKSVACLNHMIADALELLPRCLEYLETLDDPYVLSFCALPQVMAIATLATCYSNPNVFMGVVKIRKGEAVKIMLDLNPSHGDTTRIKAAYEKWIRDFLKKMADGAKLNYGTCEHSRRIVDISKKVLQNIC